MGEHYAGVYALLYRMIVIGALPMEERVVPEGVFVIL